jgi:hypothetical protein
MRQAMAKHSVLLLWSLTALFMMRVLGQMIQHWHPQTWLPAFDAFQGSGLPYWLLLSVQLLILAAMIRYAWQVQTGTLHATPRTGVTLLWLGGIYMVGSLTRLAVGIAIPSAPAWFSTWIPACLHVVLAGYVLTLASCHRPSASRVTS